MKPHWISSRSEIAGQLRAQPRILLGCDFDGTLAPIVPNPLDAKAVRGARAILAGLAALPSVEVAIISGRALDDVRSRIGLPELNYVGNHGLELQGRVLEGMTLPRSAPAQGELETALERIRTAVGDVEGLYVEDKTLTASIHFRNVPESLHAQIDDAVEAALADLPDLAANHGRMIWEIRPRVGWDKGTALRRMLEHLDLPEEAGIYIGDDTTDEDAFRAIPRGLTFYAGRRKETAARWLVDSPLDTVQLLEWICRERNGCA